MNKRRFWSITVFLLICTTFSCTEKNDPLTSGQTPDEGVFDTELVPAEDGPERSAFGVPSVSTATFQLELYGLVDSLYTLGWDDILDMPAVFTDTLIMYCVEGWQVWGVWKGIPVETLLEKASPRDTGTHILFESADGYKSVLPVSYLKKYEAMLAYEVNGSFLQKHDGFPLRLIAPGIYGYRWSKWISRMEVMTLQQVVEQELTDYADPAHVPLKRRQYFEGEEAQELEY